MAFGFRVVAIIDTGIVNVQNELGLQGDDAYLPVIERARSPAGIQIAAEKHPEFHTEDAFCAGTDRTDGTDGTAAGRAEPPGYRGVCG